MRQVINLTRPLAKAAGKVDARDIIWHGPPSEVVLFQGQAMIYWMWLDTSVDSYLGTILPKHYFCKKGFIQVERCFSLD